MHIFAARETVKDLDAMAAGMARADNKRAASSYFIDEQSAARAELKEAVAAYSKAQAAPIAETIDKAATIDATPAKGKEAAAEPKSDIAATTTAAASAALDAIGGLADKAINTLADGLASLLGGGSPAPAPPPRVLTAKEAHEARIQAFLAEERQQRAARLEQLRNSLGESPATTEEQLNQKSRDRGGGQSL